MPPKLLIYFSIEYGTYPNEPAAARGFKHAKPPLIPVRFNYSLRTLSPLNIIQRKLLQSLIPGLPNATQQWDIIPAAIQFQLAS